MLLLARWTCETRETRVPLLAEFVIYHRPSAKLARIRRSVLKVNAISLIHIDDMSVFAGN